METTLFRLPRHFGPFTAYLFSLSTPNSEVALEHEFILRKLCERSAPIRALCEALTKEDGTSYFSVRQLQGRVVQSQPILMLPRVSLLQGQCFSGWKVRSRRAM